VFPSRLDDWGGFGRLAFFARRILGLTIGVIRAGRRARMPFRHSAGCGEVEGARSWDRPRLSSARRVASAARW
jgi:hypothetical protein